MNAEVQILIDSLRRGQYEDPAEKIALLSAALQEHKADLALLLSLLRAPQLPLRLAAIDASRNRTEPELVAELVGLAQNPESRVRLKLAEILRGHVTKEAVGALQSLVQDSDGEVRVAALQSTFARPEFRLQQESALANDTSWAVRIAAVNALDSQKDPQVAKPLFHALGQDQDDDVRRRCAELIEKRLTASPPVAQKHLPTEIAQLANSERTLKQLGAHRFPKLMEWITARTTKTVDPQVLARFGTDLTALAANRTLPRAHCAGPWCETLLKLIQREPWRSIALLGPAGVGKSALVNELVYQLAKPENGGWRVLRISPTDFMAGTRYLGEWETKVRELVDEIRKPRRVPGLRA